MNHPVPIHPRRDHRPSAMEERILVLMPTAEDADRTLALLGDAGVGGHACFDVAGVCSELRLGAGALLLTEDAIFDDKVGQLSEALRDQPTWSSLPILVLAREGTGRYIQQESSDSFSNLIVVERPARTRTLLSVVLSALRARRHQYQIRDAMRERDQQIAAAIAQDERLRFALSAGGMGAWDLDLVHKRLECSPITKSNFGRDERDPFSYQEWVACAFSEDKNEILAAIERCLEQRTDCDLEYRVLWPNGTVHWVMMRGRAIYDEYAQPTHLLGVSLDITERKQMHDALISSQTELAHQTEQLQRADRLKDEFLATLAHELRNPLAPIRTGLELIANEPTGPAAERSVGVMRRQIDHMVRLIDDLLDVSRITRGKLDLQRERVTLARIVELAVESSRPLFEQRRQVFETEVEEEPLCLEADLTRCAQIVSNLLNNAAKYTPQGGIIELSAKRNGDWAEIVVSDTGVGIPQDHLEEVFEMFSQLSRTFDRSQGGLGIGLSLVRRLVEMHQGTVTAESAGAGLGSTFTVRLPLAPALVAQPTAAPRGVESRLPGRKVLVVDDNEDAAELLSLMLGQSGHITTVAHDGPSAVAVAEADLPEVVLLDIGLPGMTGYEVARKLRSDVRFDHTALVALTGWGAAEDKQKAAQAGFDYHLTKPVNTGELLAAMAHVSSLLGTAPTK